MLNCEVEKPTLYECQRGSTSLAQTPRLPLKGETVQVTSFIQVPGGKGANQAVATARLEIPTYMVGRVGDDQFGIDLVTALQQAQVNTELVTVTPNTSSGIAMIAVDQQSDNHIIVIPGANGCVNETDVANLKPLLTKAKAILLQLEVPLPALIAAAQAAKSVGVTVILDPAPAPDYLPQELYNFIDILTPNETEAQRLVGFEITDETTCQRAADILLSRGVGAVVLKLGARGVFYHDGTQSAMIEPFKIMPVDTVAAGDAFNGGMTAGLCQGLSLEEAVVWGAATGALAATKQGAFPSLPDKATFEAFLNASDN